MRVFWVIVSLFWSVTIMAGDYYRADPRVAYAPPYGYPPQAPQHKPLTPAELDTLLQSLYIKILDTLSQCHAREQCVSSIEATLTQMRDVQTPYTPTYEVYKTFLTNFKLLAESEIFHPELLIIGKISANGLKDYKNGIRVDDTYLREIAQSPDTAIEMDYIWNLVIQGFMKRKGSCRGRTQCLQYDLGFVDRFVTVLQTFESKSSLDAVTKLKGFRAQMVEAEQEELPTGILRNIWVLMSQTAQEQLDKDLQDPDYASIMDSLRLSSDEKVKQAFVGSTKTEIKFINPATGFVKTAKELAIYNIQQNDKLLHDLYFKAVEILKQCTDRETCVSSIQSMATEARDLDTNEADRRTYNSFITNLPTTTEAQPLPTQLLALQKLSGEGLNDYKNGIRVDENFLQDLAKAPDTSFKLDHIWNLLIQELAKRKGTCQGRDQCLQNDLAAIDKLSTALQSINSNTARQAVTALRGFRQEVTEAKAKELPIIVLQTIRKSMSYNAQKQLDTEVTSQVPDKLRLTSDDQFKKALEGSKQDIKLINPVTGTGKAGERLDRSMNKLQTALTSKLEGKLPDFAKSILGAFKS